VETSFSLSFQKQHPSLYNFQKLQPPPQPSLGSFMVWNQDEFSFEPGIRKGKRYCL